MKRIVIVGVTGSGKTTFGRKLAERTGIPFTDLDDLHWLPDWQMQPLDEFLRLAGGVTKNEAWIISGNYSKAEKVTWARADTMIFLEIGWWQCFRQILTRSIHRAATKQVICNGNTESFTQTFFTRRSILYWFFTTYGKKTRKYRAMMNDRDFYPAMTKISLRTQRDKDEFLKDL